MASARLNPPESRLQSRGSPEPAAVCSANIPGREGLTVRPVSNNSGRALDIDAPYIRLNFLNSVIHNASPDNDAFPTGSTFLCLRAPRPKPQHSASPNQGLYGLNISTVEPRNLAARVSTAFFGNSSSSHKREGSPRARSLMRPSPVRTGLNLIRRPTDRVAEHYRHAMAAVVLKGRRSSMSR